MISHMHKKNKSSTSIKERRAFILFSSAIVICMILAFLIIIISSNRIIDSSRDMVRSQVSYTNSTLERNFSNYYGLCSILGIDQTIAEFSVFDTNTDADIMMVKGYTIMKKLAALASIYGEDINNLAVYFPESDSIVTMTRILLSDKVYLYFDNVENDRIRNIRESPVGTNYYLDISQKGGNHTVIIRNTNASQGKQVYIIIEFNLKTTLERLTEFGNDMQVILQDSAGNIYVSSDTEDMPDYGSLFSSAEQNQRYTLDGSNYYAETSLKRFEGVSAVVATPLDALQNLQNNIILVVILTACLMFCMVFYLDISINRKVFMPLEAFRDANEKDAVNIATLVGQVNHDISNLKTQNLRYQQERKQMLPLALKRIINRLLEETDIPQQATLAYSCLTLASIDDAAYYAMYAIGCTDDPRKILEMPKDNNSQSRMQFFHFIINNVMDELIFTTYPGIVAPMRKNWFLVLLPCESESVARDIEERNQKITAFFKDKFEMSIVTTEVILENGTTYFSHHLQEIQNNILFLEFWGDGSKVVQDNSQKKNFLYYCNLVQKLAEKANGGNLETVVKLLDDVLDNALPLDIQSIQQSRDRLRTLSSIAVTSIKDRYSGTPEFLADLELDRLQSYTTLNSFREEFLRILDIICQSDLENSESGVINNRMAEIKEYVATHYADNNLNVTSLAKQFNYSVPYLSHTFKEVYNLNLLEYIQRVRISAAKELLVNHPVKEVVTMAGFWDEQALVRVFRKYEGISPAEYKKLVTYNM